MKTMTDDGYEITDALKTSRSQLQEPMNSARMQQQSMYRVRVPWTPCLPGIQDGKIHLLVV
jgi:hypothetical protein